MVLCKYVKLCILYCFIVAIMLDAFITAAITAALVGICTQLTQQIVTSVKAVLQRVFLYHDIMIGYESLKELNSTLGRHGIGTSIQLGAYGEVNPGYHLMRYKGSFCIVYLIQDERGHSSSAHIYTLTKRARSVIRDIWSGSHKSVQTIVVSANTICRHIHTGNTTEPKGWQIKAINACLECYRATNGKCTVLISGPQETGKSTLAELLTRALVASVSTIYQPVIGRTIDGYSLTRPGDLVGVVQSGLELISVVKLDEIDIAFEVASLPNEVRCNRPQVECHAQDKATLTTAFDLWEKSPNLIIVATTNVPLKKLLAYPDVATYTRKGRFNLHMQIKGTSLADATVSIRKL
jgi:hypothetical protein